MIDSEGMHCYCHPLRRYSSSALLPVFQVASTTANEAATMITTALVG